MYANTDARIASQLQNDIENELARVGVLSRVFSRAKDTESLNKKINREPGKYSSSGKKIQDIFGIRIALYFQDDSPIAQKAIKNIYEFDEKSSTIDSPGADSFSASRCNLIFKLPEELIDDSSILREYDVVDSTFEVQFRTILSEGWHEVEHDLRYKCKDDWESYDDLNRALNGIYASLETADWSMMKLFEELAYRHYKACEWSQMVRTKFRLRAGNGLSEPISNLLNNNPALGKKVFRINRTEFIGKILEDKINIPINLDNIFFLCNHYYLKSAEISSITPAPLETMFEDL